MTMSSRGGLQGRQIRRYCFPAADALHGCASSNGVITVIDVSAFHLVIIRAVEHVDQRRGGLQQTFNFQHNQRFARRYASLSPLSDLSFRRQKALPERYGVCTIRSRIIAPTSVSLLKCLISYWSCPSDAIWYRTIAFVKRDSTRSTPKRETVSQQNNNAPRFR